jgi:3-hydroxyacyl-[acyl-carrier-protein] dehydratase
MKHEVAASIGAIDRDGSTFRTSVAFAENLSVFAGHFPGAPLVPGVYLIDAARQIAERALGLSLSLAEVRDGRFTASTGPGDVVEFQIVLAEQGAGWEARVEVQRTGERVAKMRLLLR